MTFLKVDLQNNRVVLDFHCITKVMMDSAVNRKFRKCDSLFISMFQSNKQR